MAYANKYHLSYTDHIGRHTTVYIKEDEFTGASTEVTAGADPIIIETISDNDNLFNQIYASTCTINLLATSNFQFIGLFTADAFKYKVEVWKEPEPDETEALFWTGFILPDEYSEPIDFEKNYPVTVMARDVLGVLNEIDFVQDSGNRFVGKQTIIKIIAEILKKTKLNLNINFGINLVENDAPDSITGDTLESIYLDYQAFYQDDTKDCEYVLKQILQSFGARIIQSNGEWWIERIPMYLTSQTIYKYDYNGILLSSSIVNNVLNYTGKYDTTNNRLFFIEKKGNIMINPAYKEFSINQNYGKLISIIKNHEFDDYIRNKYTTVNSRGYVNYTYDYIINNWNENPAGSHTFGVATATPRTNRIGLEGNVLSIPVIEAFDATKYIQSDPVYVSLAPIGEGRTSSFEALSITLRYLSHSATSYYEIKLGNKWIADDGTFSDTQVINSYDSTTGEVVDKNIIARPNETVEGFFWIRFYKAQEVGTSRTDRDRYSFIFSVIVDFVSDYPEDIDYDIIVDENNNYQPDKIQLIIGDLPGIENGQYIYIGGYWYFNGTDYIPTSSWSYYGSSRQLSLIPLLAEAIQDQYRVSKHKISGTLFGNFQLNKTIYITMLGNRYYFPIRSSIFDKTCKTEIEAIEIVTETEADGGTVWGTENLDYVVSETDTLTRV